MMANKKKMDDYNWPDLYKMIYGGKEQEIRYEY